MSTSNADFVAPSMAAISAARDSDFPADFIPIVLGGDIGAYALGREFHEAYATKSICLTDLTVGAIKYSRIFVHVPARATDPGNVQRAIAAIHDRFAGKKLLVITNSEACIPAVLAARRDLPYVLTPTPDAQVIDLVSHKDRFTELCQQHGLDVPATEAVQLAGTTPIPPCRLPFPVVAKPAYSPDYAGYMSQGFKKVYFVEAQEQLDALWADLRAAGFSGAFVVQELVPGDDTYMDSVTIYIDSNGRPTLLGGANVLLEDHAPSMLGNPVAMITARMPQIWERCTQMLLAVGYRGYANFDVKRDPRTGRALFFEVNPRIGRNSYYNCAAGVNPMRMAVEDLVFGRALETADVTGEVLYTLVPLRLLRRYVRDGQLRDRMESLVAAGKVFDPQVYREDRGLRRAVDVQLTRLNQYRKFKRYYPQPTDTSF